MNNARNESAKPASLVISDDGMMTSIVAVPATEAHAIRARGDALKENPKMPQLVAAEKWDGDLPTTMPPGGAVPFLSLSNH